MNQPLSPDAAETLAIGALGWIAQDAERFGGFLSATGADVSDLARLAGDAEFLGSLLDFILQEDDAVLDLARTLNCPPEHVLRARASLPGGHLPNWT